MMLYQNSKKSQLFILSALMLFLALLFIYSLETQNYYKAPSWDSRVITNVQQEVCDLVVQSNGSQLPNRISAMENDTSAYCSYLGSICTLSIVNTTQIPFGGNWSNHNYTLYNYSFVYSGKQLSYTSDFTC